MKETDTTGAPPGFLNVQTEPPPLMRFSLPAALLVVVVAVIVGGLIGSLILQMPVLFALLALLFAGVVIMILVLHRQEETRAKIEEIVSRYSEDDPRAVAREIVRLWAWTVEKLPILELPGALAKRGLLGETFQVWWKAEPSPIEPFSTAFEPRLLDESDAGFDELATAAVAQCEQNNSSPEVGEALRSDQLFLRRVLRNIGLKSAWFIVIVLAFDSLLGFWVAFHKGEITWSTVYWPAFLMMILFAPVRTRLFSETQWLLLPGGLLMRRSSNRGKDVKLHLFDRRRSVLCVCPSRRNTWRLSVADAEMGETIAITDRERQLLLRAWLSPVAPPPVEQLVDLS